MGQQHLITYASSAWPKQMDKVRAAMCTKHYSLKTEQVYVHWIRRFILHHNKRYPAETGYGIRTIQELLGHKNLNTTMIYTHVLNRGGRGIRSPADNL